MELSARLFNCAGCHAQVIICSHCDRNNIYCGSVCSKRVRAMTLRRSDLRYQKTFRGRQKHAERQRRYRDRQRKKVTDHTSVISPPHAVLPPEPNEEISEAMKGHYHCHFCGNPCSSFFRWGYLRHVDQHSPPR